MAAAALREGVFVAPPSRATDIANTVYVVVRGGGGQVFDPPLILDRWGSVLPLVRSQDGRGFATAAIFRAFPARRELLAYLEGLREAPPRQ